MAASRIVVVGGSAGAHIPLQTICAGLPADFAAPMLAVVHVPPAFPSSLDKILSVAGVLPASRAKSGEQVRPGRVYVAPPDKHLVVRPDGRTELTHEPRENRFRPSIDALFRSAAEAFGPGAVAVLLSGALFDGVAGATAIRQSGGTVLLQDPDDAAHPTLLRAALHAFEPDLISSAAEIPSALCRIIDQPQRAAPQSDVSHHPMYAGSATSARSRTP